MKLRNKKTGEIVDLIEIVRINDISNEFYLRLSDNEGRTFKVGFNSLAELNKEWDDYEEPKEYWYIMGQGVIRSIEDENTDFDNKHKEIGNYFSSKEEAELAVRKLKAWKRLKDKGFEFRRWEIIDGTINFMILPKGDYREKVYEDLDICFGGE